MDQNRFFDILPNMAKFIHSVHLHSLLPSFIESFFSCNYNLYSFCHSSVPYTHAYVILRKGGGEVCIRNLEIIKGRLPSRAVIREYRQWSRRSRTRAVISKMAWPLNDNSQAPLSLQMKKKKTHTYHKKTDREN